MFNTTSHSPIVESEISSLSAAGIFMGCWFFVALATLGIYYGVKACCKSSSNQTQQTTPKYTNPAEDGYCLPRALTAAAYYDEAESDTSTNNNTRWWYECIISSLWYTKNKQTHAPPLSTQMLPPSFLTHETTYNPIHNDMNHDEI